MPLEYTPIETELTKLIGEAKAIYASDEAPETKISQLEELQTKAQSLKEQDLLDTVQVRDLNKLTETLLELLKK